MAIKVNGKLVAGLGKSAYEQAQEGGYTGTEEEFISALANIGSNPTAEGLPVNDVRTGTVRDGQSIAAGDVVNVQGGEVYRDVVAQKNVENVFAASAVTATDIISLNENYAVCAFVKSDGTFVGLIEKDTGKARGSVLVTSSVAASISLARLDDTHFVVTYVSGNDFRIQGYTVSGTSLTPMGNTGYSDVNEAIVIGFDTDSALSIAARETNIYVRPYQPSIATHYGGKSLSGIRPSNISATRIPDDDSGNRRVCICFSDTGDGNKGKAVIATVDSSNAVTFGDVVTFNEESTTDIHCTYSLDGWVYVLFIDSATQMIAFNPELLTEKTDKKQVAGRVQNSVEICAVGHSVVGIFNGYAKTIYRTENVLNIGVQFSWNDSMSAPYPSASITENNRFIIAYADGGNSNYGTTTILEIFGNQIAGSFLNNSKDAIALESGEGGDTIKLGFGGYCACEGITAGQMIDSEGVTAYSPLDGWLKIIPWQEQAEPEIAPYVIGEYTGNGASPTVIDVGFMPSVFIIGAILTESNYTTQIDYQYCVLFRGDDLFIANISRKNFSNATWKATGIEMTDSGSGAKDRFNESGVIYRYIAFR